MYAPLHIWITGASRGIGAAIAQRLGKHNRITLSGRNHASLRQVKNLLPSGHAAAVPCDVANASSIQSAHASAIEVFGPVDVLINSAGIGVFTDITTMTVQAFDDQIAINLRGVFLCTKEVVPAMIERKQGMIITVNSIAAITPFAGCTGYSASKAGALALTRSLRTEVRDNHIKVSDILVGATETDIWTQEERASMGERMMQADDIAQAAEFLVASYHNPRVHLEEIVIRPQRGDL